MDITDNQSSAMHSPLERRDAVSRLRREEEHPAGHIEAVDRLDPSSRAEYESSLGQDYASAVREAKIRELQNNIKNGTYHAVAEKIADKMLWCMLRDQLR